MIPRNAKALGAPKTAHPDDFPRPMGVGPAPSVARRLTLALINTLGVYVLARRQQAGEPADVAAQTAELRGLLREAQGLIEEAARSLLVRPPS